MGCNVRCSCRICLRICLSFVASWDASLFLPQVWLVLSLYQVLCLVCSTISSYVRYDCRATSTHGVTDLWCLQAVLTDIRLLSEYFGQKQIRLDHVGSQRSALFFSGIPAGSHCGLFSFCFKQTGQCFCPLHDDAMQIRFCSKVPRNSCTHMHACWCNNFRRVSATRIMQGANLHACHQNPFADHIA